MLPGVCCAACECFYGPLCGLFGPLRGPMCDLCAEVRAYMRVLGDVSECH